MSVVKKYECDECGFTRDFILEMDDTMEGTACRDVIDQRDGCTGKMVRIFDPTPHKFNCSKPT